MIQKNESVGIIWEAVADFSDYNWFKSVNPAWIDLHTKHTDVFAVLVGTVLPAWYGIQLALLHPVTKQIFANPKLENPTEKETPTTPKVPKPRKYIRRHTITEENNTDIAFKSALRSVNKNDHKYHTALWRVIGHYRKYKSGKVVWVKPHWKGPFRRFADIEPTKRIVDIPDKL